MFPSKAGVASRSHVRMFPTGESLSMRGRRVRVPVTAIAFERSEAIA